MQNAMPLRTDSCDPASLGAEQYARLILDSVPALIGLATPEGLVEFANRRWLEYTGLTNQQAQGDGYLRAFHPDDARTFTHALRDALASSRDFGLELRLRSAAGEYRWFEVRIAALRDAAGGVVRWCGTTTDIEERKRAENRLNRRVRLGNLFTSTLEFGELLSAIAGVLTEIRPGRTAQLALTTDEPRLLRVYATFAGAPLDFDSAIECPLQQAPGWQVLECGETVVLS